LVFSMGLFNVIFQIFPVRPDNQRLGWRLLTA
jgi:hypothetical protein